MMYYFHLLVNKNIRRFIKKNLLSRYNIIQMNANRVGLVGKTRTFCLKGLCLSPTVNNPP